MGRKGMPDAWAFFEAYAQATDACKHGNAIDLPDHRMSEVSAAVGCRPANGTLKTSSFWPRTSTSADSTPVGMLPGGQSGLNPCMSPCPVS